MCQEKQVTCYAGSSAWDGDGNRSSTARIEPHMSRSSRHPHDYTLAMRTTRHHSHSVSVYEEGAHHLGRATSRALCSCGSEVEGKQLAEHATGGVTINSQNVSELFASSVRVLLPR